VIVGSLLLILVAVTLLVLGLADGSSQLLVASIGASLLAAMALVIGARQAAATRTALDEERDAGEPELAHVGARERVAAGAPAGPPRRAGGTGTGGVGEAADLTGAADMTGAAGGSGSGGPAGAAGGRPGGARTSTMAQPAAGTRIAPAGAASTQTRVPRQSPPGTPPPDPEPVYATPQYEEQPAYPGVPDADLVADDEEDPPDEPAPQPVSPADAARVARMSTDVLVIDGRPRYHLAGCVHLLGRDREPLPVGEAIELGFTPCGLCEPDTALLA
jgi:hypothetical protein